MFENLTLIAVVISILWLASFALYLYSSRQQKDLLQDIDTLQHMLEDKTE